MQTRPLLPHETPQGLARDGYNRSARRYLEWSSSLPCRREEWIDKLFAYLGDGIATGKVLELGCGAGVPATVKLAKNVGQVVASDISSAQLELARENLGNAHIRFSNERSSDAKVVLVESDMTELEFASCSFEAVVAMYSVIHLSLSDQRVVLGRVLEWLKVGGLMLFNVAAGDEKDEGSVAEGWLGMDGAFWASFGTDETKKMLQEMGFEIVESEVIHDEGDASFLWLIVRKRVKPKETAEL